MENNVSIIPAKINEKPLKLLGIVSLVGVLLKIVYLIVDELYSYIHPDITNIILETTSSVLGLAPFILFGIYAIFLGKEKINHPVLSVSYIVLAVSSIYSFVYLAILSIETIANYIETEFFEGLIVYITSLLFSLVHSALYAVFFIIVAKDILKSFTKAKAFRVISIITIVLQILSLFSIVITQISNSIIIGRFDETNFLNAIFLQIATLLSAIPFYLFWCIVVKPAKKPKPFMPVYNIPTPAQPVYNTPPVTNGYAPMNAPAQPVYQQPVAQPMYQRPVQPVAQPVYQQPVQPVAQPMYQRPVQPQFVTPVQAPVIEDDKPTVMLRPEENFEKKLVELKKLRDAGILTDEDFEKKKTEILSRI